MPEIGLMPEIDLSKLSEKDLDEIKQKVLRDLLNAAKLRDTDGGDAPTYDKHSSLHSKG